MKSTLPLRPALLFAALISVGSVGRAQFVNPGFETGGLSGWNVSSGGQAAAVGTVTDFPIDPWTLTDDLTRPYSVSPYEGAFQARLVAGTTSLGGVETFLGLDAGALSNPTDNPFGAADASAIAQDVWFTAGDSFLVRWNFLAVDTDGIDDFAFLSLSGVGSSWVMPLSSVDTIGAGNGTGWQTATVTAAATGQYRFGLGVANFEDNTVPSILYADAISAVPEPSTYGITAALLCLAGVSLRRRRMRASV